jgi:hypothetical protein
MSIPALNWAAALPLPNVSAKCALLVLANRAWDSTNTCKAKLTTLAAECSLSPRRLQDALAFLEAAGLITRDKGKWATEYVLSVGTDYVPEPRAKPRHRTNRPVNGHAKPVSTGHIVRSAPDESSDPHRTNRPVSTYVESQEIPQGSPHFRQAPAEAPAATVTAAPTGAAGAAKTGSPKRFGYMSKDWGPNSDSRAFVADAGLDLAQTAEAFRDHCRSRAARLADFDAGFRVFAGTRAAFLARQAPRSGRAASYDALAEFERMAEAEAELLRRGGSALVVGALHAPA